MRDIHLGGLVPVGRGGTTGIEVVLGKTAVPQGTAVDDERGIIIGIDGVIIMVLHAVFARGDHRGDCRRYGIHRFAAGKIAFFKEQNSALDGTRGSFAGGQLDRPGNATHGIDVKGIRIAQILAPDLYICLDRVIFPDGKNA
ncbi:hypothetical protein SDC9_81270 [bioreactor metagenome]|uniref:Uncharacterized protein n=1 Tax=bioreactor metagenome TaxID=1076179 RepID=A0A644Z7J3_9ZZZZ